MEQLHTPEPEWLKDLQAAKEWKIEQVRHRLRLARGNYNQIEHRPDSDPEKQEAKSEYQAAKKAFDAVKHPNFGVGATNNQLLVEEYRANAEAPNDVPEDQGE